MDPGELSKPRPMASPPLARKSAQSGHRTHGRPPGTRPGPSVIVQGSERVAAKVRSGDFPDLLSEVFKEDLTYRALARKFLWEFFD